MSAASEQFCVRDFVAAKLKYLQSISAEGPQKAALAELRRGIGHLPGDIPQLWGTIFLNCDCAKSISLSQPTKEEWAIYTALTLFAMHQQGRSIKDEPMNRTEKGFCLGSAVRRLVPKGDDEAEKRILRRFNSMATSADMRELSHHLRGLIQLLRAENIPLDYPQLADDLYRFQFGYDSAASVRLRWGRDYYRMTDNENNEKKEG